MSLVVAGASYKSAPIEAREKLAFSSGEIPEALAEITKLKGINEAVILSTCNRTEIYVDAKTDRMGLESLESFVKARLGVDELDRGAFYVERSMDAARHLFRVVCSLESMVLGEAQILGQTKRAFEAAVAAGACGDVLSRLFKSAISLGKRVRTETAIGSDSVSLSTTAFKAAFQQFPDLESRRIVVLGAGEMARLALGYLLDAGARDIVVATRTTDHSRDLAEEMGIGYCAFSDRYDHLGKADAVFSMTSAPRCVVEADRLATARREADREGEPLVVIDESVPRDVDPACGELSGVLLYDLERLSSIVDEGLSRRMAAVGEVERMVQEAGEEFFSWMQERSVTPTIKEMHEKGDITVQKELKRLCKALASARGEAVSADEIAMFEAFGSAIANKILHGPIIRLRKEAKTGESFYYTSSARYLFGLDAMPPGTACGHCKDPSCFRGEGCSMHERRRNGEPDERYRMVENIGKRTGE